MSRKRSGRRKLKQRYGKNKTGCGEGRDEGKERVCVTEKDFINASEECAFGARHSIVVVHLMYCRL